MENRVNDYTTGAKETSVVYGDNLSGTVSTLWPQKVSVRLTQRIAITSDFVERHPFASSGYAYVKYVMIVIFTHSFRKLNRHSYLSPRADMLMPRDIKNLRLRLYKNNYSYYQSGGDIIVDSHEMGNTFFIPLDSAESKYVGISNTYDTSYTGAFPCRDMTFSSDYWTVTNFDERHLMRINLGIL